ncbi:hypothetical protein LCGC14_2361630, partial [marine sediment metagenome]
GVNDGYPSLSPGSELTGRYAVVGIGWNYIDRFGQERRLVGTPV